MNGLSLNEQYQIAQIVSHLQYLRELDSIWTQYLASATLIEIEDKPILQSVVNEMRNLLQQIPGDSEWIHNLIAKDPQWINDTVNEFLSHNFTSIPLQIAEQMSKFIATAQEYGGFSVILDGASTYLNNHSSAASDQIAEKMDKIANGQYTQGDLPGPYDCALILTVSMLSSLAGTVIHLLLPVGIGGFISFGVGGCIETMGDFIDKGKG